MKSLNDSLRDEFSEILQRDEYRKVIDEKSLDVNVLKKAFDILLKYKSDVDMVDKSRTEFENYLINYFKSQKNDN
ncbi:hypothetical protein [Sphingobacterium lactis]|uniref:Uncharacterized protein n=1 Tax=Sphingobacterium lactis TaxID=797291 RepID=A0A1H5TWG2_9SPHI|nr:hypothetical protein [Sphingobacterium lactis]SEF67090.1 hypothetical protein SAMN05421877_102100 [Sphingobacterium lactis]